VTSPAPPVEEVRPGVWSMPQPMPGPLGHVFAYAIEAGEGVILVDAGWNGPDGLSALDQSLRSFGASVNDVDGAIFTHAHRDHYGLAGPLREESGAWLAVHASEPLRFAGERTTEQVDAWLTLLGVPSDERAELLGPLAAIAGAGRETKPDRLLVDGESLDVGVLRLEVMHTPGHSPGHICLAAREAGIVFTGDHVLSETTPNVGIFPGEGGSPLSDYQRSLERMGPLGDLLTLPGHERRVEVAPRAEALLEHHVEQLRHARRLVEAGYSTVRAVAAQMPWLLTWDQYGPVDHYLALAETYAHLVVLQESGDLVPASFEPLGWRVA
jgi:glyoxylase-like metal-dependent hydrolase (beta-lactamase superfamily II)